ncbi:MAG: DUF1956 domain-containing protein [Hyphomicrobiales bacterium]|nr:MAG: DUF1956 domain-containing protein [Hyphomicrobiales bacterium]
MNEDTKPNSKDVEPRSLRRGEKAGAAAATRLALLEAALTLFGSKGYDATTTREIAAAAGANIASIAYHFGGKEGLRQACVEFIMTTMMQASGMALATENVEGFARLGADEARERLIATAERFAVFLLDNPKAGLIVRFMSREIMAPSAALDTIYARFLGPAHTRVCALWAAATGMDAESEETRLLVFSLIGQAVYFRIAREVIMRRMAWETIGTREVALSTKVLLDNLNTMLDSHTGARDA